MRRLLARLWAALLGRGRPPVEPSPVVADFLAGASVRRVAYFNRTGDDWPAQVRAVEQAIRDYARDLAEENERLRAELARSE